MSESPRVLMVAAENDELPGAKVGGVADVMRDLPAALRKKDCLTHSVIPSYGKLARLPGLEKLAEFELKFSGKVERVSLFKRAGKQYQSDIFILDSPLFAPQGERVYCHDGSDRPFATDATKFAFFSAAVATALVKEFIPRPEILHCHDWHSAFLFILIRFSPEFAALNSIKTVLSIHNLAMQGVRPFRGDPSSFENWFPDLIVDPREIADPKVPHCINPMRAGIVIADKVHTVSPTYAEEILRPSDTQRGLYGGEGLEKDLQHRADHGDLIGILNGCEYPRASVKASNKPSKSMIVKTLESALFSSAVASRELLSAHWLAEKRIKQWAAKKKEGMLLTSVGRITEQKARLLVTEVAPGISALSALLTKLGNNGVFIMVGSGDAQIEQSLAQESATHSNFIFINGFAPELADMLYRAGDLFVMPSSFEPCGISQLLAMRAGQPCLVNRVGGLRDTVEPNKTGFAFEGQDVYVQAKAMVTVFEEALRVYTSSAEIWQGICKAAAKQRFTWDKSVEQYLEKLYA